MARSPELIQRNAAVVQMRAEGKKLIEIATQFGISRVRVLQILRRAQVRANRAQPAPSHMEAT